MTLEHPPPPDTGSSGEGGTLVFISDASAEAERLSAALRAKGYALFDVPLGLLVNRVAVQRPSLVICDADAPGALDAVRRVREVSGGQRIDVIFLGEPGRTLDASRVELEREASGTFTRPVDVDLLTRKVEALIGPPSAARAMSLAPGASRSPVLVASTRRPYRFEGPTSFRPPAPPSTTLADSAPPGSAPTSSGMTPTSSAPPAPQSVAPGPPPLSQARLSPELEMLLGRAEARVRQVNQSPQPNERLSPEAELDAILPPDLLAALDEPLDVEDDDDDDDDVGAGTAGGSESESRSGRTGHGTGHGSVSGTGTGAGTAGARAETNAGASRPPQSEGQRGEGGDDEAMEEAPVTPPALRTRNPPPVSLRTALDPIESARIDSGRIDSSREATSVPSGPPPQPSEPPSFGTGVGQPQLEPLSAGEHELSTRPPRFDRDMGPSAPPPPSIADLRLEVPASLGQGDAIRGLARAVRARFSGAIAFEDSAGIRRVLFRDGDFVTAASGSAGESLVEFLAQRGDLAQEIAGKLARKLQQFGRHAGAALVAAGHLRQDELWNVLRAHAEWIIMRVATIERGGASVELEVPARLSSEPGVFGGATGAEVLLEVVRRVVSADDALKRLGGNDVRLVAGPSHALLGECALGAQDSEWVREAQAARVSEVIERAGSRDFAAVLYALTELGVLRSSSTPPRPAVKAPPQPVIHDQLDDAALRARISRRRSLVEEGDYFALLGVAREATSYDVRRAYQELRREFESGRILTANTADLRDDVDLIVEVLDEAYEILGDDLRRERYRRALEANPL